MKKSTKIITTAVALVLVMSFMVVGILAATSATANITAQVNWTATPGVQFTLRAMVSGSNNDTTTTIATVNTTTTNANASSSATLNASFKDSTDDGVNNPSAIRYYYEFHDDSMIKEGSHYISQTPLKISITKFPSSNSNVKVSFCTDRNEMNSVQVGYEWNPFEEGSLSQLRIETQSDNFIYTYVTLVIQLEVLTPDTSFSGFDAGISFKIEKA